MTVEYKVCRNNRMPEHYHLDVTVDANSVRVLKEEFNAYTQEYGGFTLCIEGIDPADEPPSPELQNAIHGLFVRLLVMIDIGNFQRIQ